MQDQIEMRFCYAATWLSGEEMFDSQ